MALRSNFPDELTADQLPALEAHLFDAYEEHPDLVPKIYNVHTSKRWGEQTTTVAGLPAVPTKPEGTAYTFADPLQGYDRTYTHTEYGLAVSFSQTLIEDDQFGLVKDTYRSTGKAVYQTRQVQAADFLNSGFGDTGPDGVSLFNTAHVMIDLSTQANRPTSEVTTSVAGLREMETNQRNQVNHRSINIMIIPRMICIPPVLYHQTMELVKSVDRPDTANRSINTFYNENYDIVVSPFFTSTTAWCVLADKGVHELRWYDRVLPSTDSWVDKKTGDVNTSVRMRFSSGYSDFLGSWGTSG